MRMNRFEEYALGRPYHAALVDLRDARDPHGHPDFYEVMVVLDGAGRQDRGDGVQPLRPGEVLLIRPGDHHALSSADAAGLRFFNVAFPAAAWRTFADLSGLGSGWDAASTTPTGRVRTGTVEACHRVLERFYDSPTMLDLVRFWIDVMPVLHRAEPSSESTAPRWLAAACAAMRRPEHLRAGVPGLLSLAHVSPAHLARTMRRHYGVTPTEFVAQLRLRRAATLLAGTSVSITEIGADCGYASASYFTRCFHSAHRMSPSEFRRAARDAFVP
jgi:AraC-like DNA-binding protein